MKKLKFRIFFTLFIFLCVLAGFALAKRYTRVQRTPAEKRLAKLPHFETENVSEITLSWKKIRTTIVRANDSWVISERKNASADPEKVRAFLANLAFLKALRSIDTEDRSLISKLRVGKSEKDPIPGVLVCVRDKKGNMLFELVMGLGFFIRDDSPEVSPDRVPDGRYFGIYTLNGKALNRDLSPAVVLSSAVFSTEHPIPGAWVMLPDLSRLPLCNEMKFMVGKTPIWHVKRIFPDSPFRDMSGLGLPVDMRQIQSLYTMFTGRWLEDVREDSLLVKFRREGRFEATGNGVRYYFDFSRSPGAGLKKSLMLRFGADALPGASENARKEAENFLSSVRGKLYLLGPREFSRLCRVPLSELPKK